MLLIAAQESIINHLYSVPHLAAAMNFTMDTHCAAIGDEGQIQKRIAYQAAAYRFSSYQFILISQEEPLTPNIHGGYTHTSRQGYEPVVT